MITLIEPPDDGSDGSDDELAVLLRPGAFVLAPPPGAFRQIRRRASRRRLVRAVATAGAGAAMTATAITIALWPPGTGSGPTQEIPPLAPQVHATTGGPSGGTSGGTSGPVTGGTSHASPSPAAPPSTSDPSTGPAPQVGGDGRTVPPRAPLHDPSSRTEAPIGVPHALSSPSTTRSDLPSASSGIAVIPTTGR